MTSRGGFVATICVSLLTCWTSALSLPSSEGQQGNVIYIPLPGDVSKGDVLAPSESLKTKLNNLVADGLRRYRALEAPESNAPERLDAIVVFLDEEGRPILPDLEAARVSAAEARASLTGSELEDRPSRQDVSASPARMASVLAPTPPSNLTATVVSTSRINLHWTDNSMNEQGFTVERAAAVSGPWSPVATIPTNQTSFSDSGLAPSTDYYYRVQAFNNGGGSGYSNIATARTQTGLAFTFDSPTDPWTDAEKTTLLGQLNDFYPEAKIVYGEPAFSIIVNVRKDPNISVAAYYNPSLNEMVLPNASNPDALCHEMIHAFRDDDVVRMGTFEEGMTRAAEVEVFNRLPAYQHWDEGHSYTYDVYYEALNRRTIGSVGGGMFTGYVSPLLRYQLAGYAWAKVYLENQAFFSSFNGSLYARAVIDPNVLGDEVTLVGLASSAQGAVEGDPFATWYLGQGVLSTRPPRGAFLYQRVNQFTVDDFVRDASDLESMQAGVSIQWTVHDDSGSLLDSGTLTTTSLGWGYFNPTVPTSYTGRIEVVVTANTPLGMISDVSLRPWQGEVGVFGIVPESLTGSVEITPLDGQASPVTVAVVRGSFSAGSLSTVRGRFLATYAGPGGQTFSRQFTKDASDYFLVMGEPSDPCIGPKLLVSKAGAQTTVSWIPRTSSTFDLVRGSLATLKGTRGDFTQALNAISPASDVCMSNDTTALSVIDNRPKPAPGTGDFYVLRAKACGGQGTYDSGVFYQSGSRDVEIGAATGTCP